MRGIDLLVSYNADLFFRYYMFALAILLSTSSTNFLSWSASEITISRAGFWCYLLASRRKHLTERQSAIFVTTQAEIIKKIRSKSTIIWLASSWARRTICAVSCDKSLLWYQYCLILSLIRHVILLFALFSSFRTGK